MSGTSASSSPGDTYVSVQYTVNGQSVSASVRFTVINPATYVASNYPGGASATTPYNSGNNSGYITSISYYLHDQWGNTLNLPGVPATETLATINNPYGASFIPPDNSPLTVTSDLNGHVTDLLYAYAAGGLPQGFTAQRTQLWTVNGFNYSPNQAQTYSQSSGTLGYQTLSRQ